MTDTSTDVEATTVGQFKLTRGIAAIFHWQKRWGQERRLALAAVRMARQNAAPIAAPARQVASVGVMAEHERGTGEINRLESRLRHKTPSPKIIEADDLQTSNLDLSVAEYADTRLGEHSLNTKGDVRISERRAVVVVAENGSGTKPTVWKLLQQTAGLRDGNIVSPARDKVSGVNHDVGLERSHMLECLRDVAIVHLRPDMNIAKLDEPFTHERGRQVGDQQITINDFQPMWLNPPSVEAGQRRRG